MRHRSAVAVPLFPDKHYVDWLGLALSQKLRTGLLCVTSASSAPLRLINFLPKRTAETRRTQRPRREISCSRLLGQSSSDYTWLPITGAHRLGDWIYPFTDTHVTADIDQPDFSICDLNASETLHGASDWPDVSGNPFHYAFQCTVGGAQ